MKKLYIIFLVSFICCLVCKAETKSANPNNSKQEIIKTGSVTSFQLSIAAIKNNNKIIKNSCFFCLTTLFPKWKQETKTVNLKNKKVPPQLLFKKNKTNSRRAGQNNPTSYVPHKWIVACDYLLRPRLLFLVDKIKFCICFIKILSIKLKIFFCKFPKIIYST